MSDLRELRLGEHGEELELNRSEAHRDVAVSMANQARRALDITTRHLDPMLYDNAEFIEAVKRVALAAPRSRIRIIIMDPAPLVSRGHRLLDLAQHLTSSIMLRQPGAEHRLFNEAWLLADGTGFVRRKFSDRLEGICNFADPRTTAELTDRFEEMWERSQGIASLRRLHI